MRPMTQRRGVLPAVALAGLTLGLAACGGDSTGTSGQVATSKISSKTTTSGQVAASHARAASMPRGQARPSPYQASEIAPFSAVHPSTSVSTPARPSVVPVLKVTATKGRSPSGGGG